MKMSINNRLFLTVTLLIVFFVLFSWLMNSNFLSRYYVLQKKQALLEATAMIDSLYTGDLQDLDLQLERLERAAGMNILIVDSSLETKYRTRENRREFSPPPDKKEFHPQPRDPHLSIVSFNQQRLLAGEKIFAVSRDADIQIRFLNLVSVLNNGDYLLLSTPLAAMQESASIANRFFLFTGLLSILVGSIFMYLFSRRFTRPILELNAIAQRMARLDFSQKYRVNTEDEIGELGRSINSLSAQLDMSITELTEANEKLRLDIEHERRIDEMRKEFISNVSHELKTPIALIQGYAEGLRVNIVEDEDSKNYYCDVIGDEANKMNKMVKELLDLSQIESGYFNLERQDFDMNKLVSRVVSKFEPILKENNIRLNMAEEESCLVNGDIFRIEQVLLNYLNNAINHIDERKQLIIKLAKLDGKVRVSVFNSGATIPEESIDKIFISFYKVDKARTRSYGGTGLGLSIVRAIQEMHNNAYGLINQADGVEFYFDIDLAGS